MRETKNIYLSEEDIKELIAEKYGAKENDIKVNVHRDCQYGDVSITFSFELESTLQN